MLKTITEGTVSVAKALATRSIEFEMDRIPFRLERVPTKKLLNWIATEASVHAKPSRPWGMPTIAKVEVSSLCNLSCTFCPVTTGLKRPQGLMSYDLFKKFIDQAGDYLLLLILWDWGEPLVNPRLTDMIAYARKAGVKTVTSTNGMLLSKDGLARRLVASGLDSLIVAVDGLTEEIQGKYRQKSKLGQVVAGIKAVVEAKQELGSESPLLNFRMVVSRHNEAQLDTSLGLAKELGVDMISFKTLNSYDILPSHDDHTGASFIPDNKEHRRFEVDPQSGQRIKVDRNACRSLWNCPDLHWNGSMVPCCFDHHDDARLGDLSYQNVRQIWYGDAYRAIRRQFSKDWTKHELCGNCSYAFVGGDCRSETVRIAHYFTPGKMA